MSKDVDWNVEEIHLKDNDLSQLPDSPTCHNLVKLFLQVPRLTVIPPNFFQHMPVLVVLDLSNTNILSLPSSISSLSLLREFFLRDCSALIELPTQIGALTELKLFDIEGTEIMYIPKEMGNLKDLECLRVSLSPYADYYIKTKCVGETIIPRMMISELNKLKELCISVSPEAEWWESEVEAIQHELCSLEDLETLKWYLPTNKVLQQFLLLERKDKPIYAYLSSFMLTIGQHAQLTSCLPRDLEKKFEKFKRCLKYINGEGSMDDISKIIGNAEAFFLHRHWTGVKLSAFNIKNLKYCLLVECNEMQTLGEADELSEDVETGIEYGEIVGLESLQYLSIHYMKKLQSIWKGPIGNDSLSRLRILALHTCPELTTIFTPSMVINLLSLVELTVEDCPKVKLVISESANEQAPEPGTDEIHLTFCPTFTSLKRIFLLDLPELVNIGRSIFPELDSMLIYNCPNLSCVSMEELPHIKEIKGETEWWNALNCDKSKWNNIFVQLQEKRDLVVQLVEATNSLQHFHDIVKISEWLEYDEKKSSSSTDMRGQGIQADTTMEKGKGIFLQPEAEAPMVEEGKKMTGGDVELVKEIRLDSDVIGVSVHDGVLEFGQNSSLQPISLVHSDHKSSVRNRTTGAIARGVAAGAALLFTGPARALAWWRRRKSPKFFDVPEDIEVHLRQLKRFSLRELRVVTDNFSNRSILGRGGFGKVYKGRLADGTLVAVKRLKEERTQGGEVQFQTEVEMMSIAVHRNLLRLQGFCMTSTERLLVYPYMANGSVASCLRDRPDTQAALVWPIRKRIALESARGLAYLHDDCDPKIIHRDVKAANIFLDEEFEAVVGGFELAKFMDHNDSHVTTAVRGTIGHIAPEYLSTGKCSEKADVFAYGMMLLELITGQRAFDLARLANDDDVMLLDWVKGLLREKKLETLVDTNLEGNYVKDEIEQLIHLSLLCTQASPLERPKMSEVVRMLKGDGLAERWEELQEFSNSHNPHTFQITYNPIL